MQLSRSNEEHDRTTQRYKQEIVRQSQVIQKLHMYLATQNYDSESEDRRSSLKYDSEVDNGDHADNVSITSAGQFQRSGDMTATKEETAPLEKEDDVSRSDMKINMDSTENEFETKLKYLASKSTEGGEYVLHMQKLQVIQYTYLIVFVVQSTLQYHYRIILTLIYNDISSLV